MFKHTKWVLALFILASTIFFFGCQEEQSITSPQLGGKLSKDFVSVLTLDPGATISSATLYLFKTNHSSDVDHEIAVHKIAEDWDCPITWNDLGAGFFNATVEADFITNPIGDWVGVDIKDVVEDWLAGEDNFGILLKNLDPTNTGGWANWPSSLASNASLSWPDSTFAPADYRPYLEVIVGDDTINVLPELDTYVQENRPTDSFCDAQLLYAGIAGDFEKYTLMRFLVEPTPPEETCETAYAFEDAPDGTCFIDLGFSNWGWSIYLPAPDTYTFEVWAAAGQCNLNNGTHVGNIEVVYTADGTVTFDLTLFPGFTLDEEHYYAGETPTPLDKKGKATVAPGSYTISNIGADGGYIIAHAVVCSSDWD